MLIENYSDSEITNQEFQDIINNSREIVVVNFFAEWCINCLMMHPIVEYLAEQMNEIKFVKINIEDNQGLAKKYNITKIPCLIIFKEGTEVNRLKGNPTVEIIENTIKNCIKC